MKLYYLSLDAQFDNEEDILEVEKKYNLVITNITKFEVQLCNEKGETYCGPSVYIFIGKWTDIVNYLVNGYTVNDVDELQEVLNFVKPIEI